MIRIKRNTNILMPGANDLAGFQPLLIPVYFKVTAEDTERALCKKMFTTVVFIKAEKSE